MKILGNNLGTAHKHLHCTTHRRDALFIRYHITYPIKTSLRDKKVGQSRLHILINVSRLRCHIFALFRQRDISYRALFTNREHSWREIAVSRSFESRRNNWRIATAERYNEMTRGRLHPSKLYDENGITRLEMHRWRSTLYVRVKLCSAFSIMSYICIYCSDEFFPSKFRRASAQDASKRYLHLRKTARQREDVYECSW